ncbi:MAG: hypothetical protein U0P45_14055 [Acidimicrobiales bacterium]
MAGFRYQIVRGRGDWYEDRSTYVSGQLDKREDAPICQVMTEVVREAHLVPAAGTAEPWHGFPWLTPVVGSGCLEIGSANELSPAQVAGAVSDAVERLLQQVVGTDGLSDRHNLPGLSAEFARRLVADRMSGDEAQWRGAQDDAPPPKPIEVDDLKARVVLTATLLNRTYFLAKVLADSPIPRWNSDVVSLRSVHGNPDLRRELDSLRELCDAHLDELVEQKAALSRSLKDVGPRIPVAIHQLMSAVLDDLRGKRVRFSRLKLVTEVAWYVLTVDTPLYPGWTDLLFKLMLGDEYQTTATTTRPAFSSLAGVGEKVAELFHKPADLSWRAWVEAVAPHDPKDAPHGFTERQSFYVAIAEMLEGQARVRASQPMGKLPVASAFCAGFDLEVEMALMATSEPGSTFYVVVPVQVLPESDSEHAKLCWLRARFERPRALGPDLAFLLEPEAWDLVHPSIEEGMDRPHVVHLSGCPLLPLPQRDGRHGAVLDAVHESMSEPMYPFAPQRMVLEHAVTIDEYLALQQSEAELLWSVVQETGGTGRDASGKSLALPPLMMSSSTEKGVDGRCPRFWMTLGVPVADPAIRSRIVTQLSLKMLLGKTQQGAAAASSAGDDDELEDLGGSTAALGEHSSLAGVVVNRRLTSEEGGILYWLGLDVVNDFAESFVDDVRHYTLHLDPGRSGERIRTHGPCALNGDR